MARYEKGHKATTHQRVVRLAAQRFRESGLAAVGVASLMGEAGLTHGGFYGHFPSKQVLIREALVSALSDTRQHLEKVAQEQGGLAALIGEYLSVRHRDNPAGGCAIAALAAEVRREPDETRQAFAEQTQALLEVIQSQLPPSTHSPDGRHAKAVLATMLGTLLLARTATDPAEADAMLDIGTRAALQLAHPTQSV